MGLAQKRLFSAQRVTAILLSVAQSAGCNCHFERHPNVVVVIGFFASSFVSSAYGVVGWIGPTFAVERDSEQRKEFPK